MGQFQGTSIDAADTDLTATLAGLDDATAARIREALERVVRQRTARATAALLGAQEAGGVGTYEICLSSGRTVGTPQFFRLFGLGDAQSELNPEEWVAVLHPEDRPRVVARVRGILRSETLGSVNEYRILVGGDVRWMRSCDRIERDARGHPVRAYGAVLDITSSKLADERVWHAAHHDALTGLPNRKYFGETLERLLASCEGEGSAAALFMLDLDGLKRANDRHGHAAGDHLIRTAAERLAAATSGGGACARVGGDEFAMALPLPGTHEAAMLGCELVSRLARPLEWEGAALDPGVSIGGALAPEHARDASRLLRAADVALCMAKRRGRRRSVFYAPGLEDEFRAADPARSLALVA
jgi:diguanylate cyclase (GGDEF)-like protein